MDKKMNFEILSNKMVYDMVNDILIESMRCPCDENFVKVFGSFSEEIEEIREQFKKISSPEPLKAEITKLFVLSNEFIDKVKSAIRDEKLVLI